jgi:hypothetical protein
VSSAPLVSKLRKNKAGAAATGLNWPPTTGH